jgi:hypothetical protein
MRNNNLGNNNTGAGNSAHKLQLVTDFDGRKTPLTHAIPMSASAYVPPIGHTLPHQHHHRAMLERDDRAQTALTTTSWEQKDRALTGRASNPNLQYGYQQGKGNIPNIPPIPQQYLQQQQSSSHAPRLGIATGLGQGQGQSVIAQPAQGFINSPIDVPSLIATKGYNPATFDVRPQSVSFRSFYRLVCRLTLGCVIGAIFRYQIVYRGRCAQVFEV